VREEFLIELVDFGETLEERAELELVVAAVDETGEADAAENVHAGDEVEAFVGGTDVGCSVGG